MLQAYETYGRQSGVTVNCDKPCRVLSGVNWELQLSATHDRIVFVDKGSTFVSSLDFARAIQHSDNYYVLVTREDLSTLPYSVNAILEHPADFIESSEFFSWERFFTNLLEQRTKDVPYMRYDKAKLPEFYLQEENLEKIIAEMG